MDTNACRSVQPPRVFAVPWLCSPWALVGAEGVGGLRACVASARGGVCGLSAAWLLAVCGVSWSWWCGLCWGSRWGGSRSRALAGGVRRWRAAGGVPWRWGGLGLMSHSRLPPSLAS